MSDELVLGHLQELRRGTVVLACLAALRRPLYGYRLIEDLAGAGITVGADTLYPLLRRLENQGLLASEWNVDESRPRKFYVTTDAGRDVLDALVTEWRSLDAALATVLDPPDPDPGITESATHDPNPPAATEKP